MDRIEGSQFLIIDETSGKRLFTNGPPATAVPATHLNNVQEEVLAVIEGANIIPSAQETVQLRNAILNMIMNSV